MTHKPFTRQELQMARLATGNANAKPTHLPCERARWAVQDECFAAVLQQTKTHGGQQVCGWHIRECKGVFIEAEFHCVWRSRAGVLIDVAAHPMPCRSITFVVDPKMVYEGHQVDNVRLALTDDRDVQHWLDLQAEYVKLVKQAHTYQAFAAASLAQIDEIKLQIANATHQLRRRYPHLPR